MRKDDAVARKVSSDSVKLDDVVIETDKGNEFTVGEIKHSNRIVKSATPKYTPDWYLKWISSMFVLAAMSMRGVEGLQFYDLTLSIVGITGWLGVSFLWKDRALIILNGTGLLFLLRNLAEYMAGA